MKRFCPWLVLVYLVTVVWLAQHAPLYAQDATPARTVTADEVNTVARELWCPLCSGVRLDTCELKACEQMRQEIAVKLAAGEDTQTIKDYFVAQYGPQVLGEPLSWVAWVLPAVALIGGALFIFMRSRHLFARPTPAGSGGSSASNPPNSPPENNDPYARQLEEELKQYG